MKVKQIVFILIINLMIQHENTNMLCYALVVSKNYHYNTSQNMQRGNNKVCGIKLHVSKDKGNEIKKNKGKTKIRNRSLSSPIIQKDDDFETILQKYDFDSRMIKVNQIDLPLIGEVHADGKWQLCIITGIKASSKTEEDFRSGEMNSITAEISPPLINILLIESDVNYHNQEIVDKYSCVVDIGQLTSIWKDVPMKKNDNVIQIAINLSKCISTLSVSLQKLPVNHIEKSMQMLYDKSTRTNRRSGGGLTKKDVGKIAISVQPSERSQHLEQILRKSLKAGIHGKASRLVDSFVSAECIMGVKINSKFKSSFMISLLIGAKLLARDSELGGRFRRSGCIFVSTHYSRAEIPCIEGITVLNGGWTAVDESVKAGTEARKFAKREKLDGANGSVTSADERIIYRLECFAMGEIIQNEDSSRGLELDLRETLHVMNLPLTPKGAQAALIKLGRWSKDEAKLELKTFQPWSIELLQSAKELSERERRRKESICRGIANNSIQHMEGRTNLVKLPSICVDAKRTSFRDDAIGVRPRSSTGRKVNTAASKWEILVHIADVSDIYAPNISRTPNDNFDFKELRQAAENRIISRYDLPFGPLHLMPPTALKTLALTTRTVDGVPPEFPINRCVTIWAYIDERNGKIIDAGIERTVISAPYALTFDDASEILAGHGDTRQGSIKQISTVLSIVDRTLSRWKANRIKNDKAALERENRMNVREIVAKEVLGEDEMRDDGADGSFQRTQGHRLVDEALNLYGSTISKLLRATDTPIPRASGAERDGRVATAPLRRYIDGVAQRQALSVLCNYGGPPLSKSDCANAKQLVNTATNRKRSINVSQGNANRKSSLKILQSHLSAIGDQNQHIIPAISTGKNNNVVISGLGLIVQCGGVQGSLKGGDQVMVEITKLDPDNGILKVNLI